MKSDPPGHEAQFYVDWALSAEAFYFQASIRVGYPGKGDTLDSVNRGVKKCSAYKLFCLPAAILIGVTHTARRQRALIFQRESERPNR